MTHDPTPPEHPFRPLTAEKKRRNWAIFFALVAFVVIIYAITIVKLKGGA